MILELQDLHAGYRRLEILHGLSLHVDKGEIVSLIGANGAGKTTTLRAIHGLVSTTGGRIVFDGKDVHRMRAHQIVRSGLVHVAQDRALFGDLQVSENLEMGAYTQPRSTVRASLDESSTCSRSWPPDAPSAPTRCPAASSRCWRSAGR